MLKFLSFWPFILITYWQPSDFNLLFKLIILYENYVYKSSLDGRNTPLY